MRWGRQFPGPRTGAGGQLGTSDERFGMVWGVIFSHRRSVAALVAPGLPGGLALWRELLRRKAGTTSNNRTPRWSVKTSTAWVPLVYGLGLRVGSFTGGTSQGFPSDGLRRGSPWSPWGFLRRVACLRGAQGRKSSFDGHLVCSQVGLQSLRNQQEFHAKQHAALSFRLRPVTGMDSEGLHKIYYQHQVRC